MNYSNGNYEIDDNPSSQFEPEVDNSTNNKEVTEVEDITD